MTNDLQRLIEAGCDCPHCDGGGWLYFSCGTSWRCRCNPVTMKYGNRAWRRRAHAQEAEL